MPAIKFVRLDENQRVLEKYRVEKPTLQECRDVFSEKITKAYHADYVNYFIEVADSHAPELGQQWTGTEFIDYVPPQEVLQARINQQAELDIDRLERLALKEIMKYVHSKPDCPQTIKDLVSFWQAEKEKIK